MKARISTLVACVLFTFWGGAMGATRYVDDSVSASGDGTSWQTAFETIQEGIDAASAGDTVIVGQGTYVENIHFEGKNIVLTSIYPPDPDIVANTIIDGEQSGSVVTFAGTEDEGCVLTGFTIQNGYSMDGGGICGGDRENHTRATIRNNVITNNEGYEDDPGGGLAYCDGLIEKNVITGNSGSYAGGGLAYCNGTIAGNEVTKNRAGGGGGLYDCGGVIRSNVISENHGGGLTYCNGIIQNNIISNNSAGNGGGLHECNGTIVNNTVVGNSAESRGGGLCGCEGLILNCIIYGNTANSGDQLWGSSEPTYSCIQRWAGGGGGNIPCCPYFVDGANGNYHLKSYSPCIDAGDPSSDFSKEPQPNGGRINMGAYGNTPEAASASPDSDKDGLPDEWEMLVFGDLRHGTSEDSDGDLWTNFQEYCHATDPAFSRKWYVDGSVARSGDGSSWDTAFKLIQEGINAASSGETVVVAEGLYAENIRFFYSLPKLEPIFEENFDSYTNLYTNDDLVNAGWKVVNGSGNLEVAWRLWNTGGEPMVVVSPDLEGMTENYMITNSDFSVEAEVDEELITPEIDCRGWEKVRLHFNKNYRIYDDPFHLQIAEVDMRVFDEVSGAWGDWTNLLHLDCTMVPLWTDPAVDSDPEQADLSGYADGKRIQLRWHFYEAVWDYWFAIDDVLVSGVPVGLVSHPVPVMRDDDLANGTKNITLRSKDPSDAAVVANTIIEAREHGPVVTFLGTEDESCLLAGFTIRNGDAHEGGGICGGTSDTNTHASIRSNVITGNSARYYGGGIACCGGVIENNVISNSRSGFSGGGLAGCQGLIRNNTITDNSCGNWGGGLYACDATIQNNIISRNSSDTDGGGLSDCDGLIVNNTICDNEADFTGGGLYRCNGSIRNCIVWGNVAPVRGHQLFDCSEPTYSCIQNWHDAGKGNISAHPYFLNSEHGDYHLKSYSPCIDAGDPLSDFSKEPQPNGGRINIGAYGNTPEAASASADSDKDGLPDEWETLFFGGLKDAASEDSDGDGWSNVDEYLHGTDPASFKRWYVDGSVGSSGDGTSWETAFNKVQQGIDAASDGDIVLVAEGVYTEKIRFPGKNITVSSRGPGDPTAVANTVLDGGLAGPVVTFWGLEGEFCVLSGFTIRNGRAEDGGGIHGRGARATICNNVISGNWATDYGGGLYLCDGMIHSNTIGGNSAGDNGGGLAYCNGVIESNIIRNNRAMDYGGGLSFCGGVIRNSTIADNSAGDYGGGLGACGGVIENNVIVNNSARRGGGLCGCGGTIRNCIIWGNTASNQWPQLQYCSKPSYSCIQNWREGGIGNISLFPHFVDPEAGDFRLQSWSPCIDAGDPSSDFSNEPQPNGGRIDIGAYGNTLEAASASPDIDEDLLPDDWEMLFFGHLRQGPSGDADGNGWSNLQEYLHGADPTSFRTWYVDASVAIPGDGTSWQTAFQIIQHGLNAAFDGDMVIVAEGTYRENIDFQGKSITLTSTNPCAPSVVASTILDGQSKGSVVTFSGSEDDACVLTGFTIRNGQAKDGGGIAGSGTYATIQNNVVTKNIATNGGGIAYCHGMIQNNTLTGNSANGHGGGLTYCHGVVRRNSIECNSARDDGGGLHECDGRINSNTIFRNLTVIDDGGGLCQCDGTIDDNLISENSANDDGGGLAHCHGTIQNNIVTSNSAQDFSGGLYWCNGTIKNNIITDNSGKHGGGLSHCSGTVVNNTVAANIAAGDGGGFYACGGTIRNCIVFGNAAPLGAQLYSSSTPIYSCLQDWTEGGEGNITDNPQFISAPESDFRLLLSSPCVDAGENYFSAYFDTDAAGTHRIMYGGKSLTVDMGAYEYIFNDLKPGPSVDETTLTWSSLPYTTYSIFYSHDLLTWHLACEVPSSDIETTSWIDDGSKTGIPPSLAPRRFYRLLENP